MLVRALLIMLLSRREVIAQQTVIACMGDSITAGSTVSSPELAWPAQLDVLFGESVSVLNFGRSGRTVMLTEDAYTATNFYRSATRSGAHIGIVMLGTNDAKDEFWDNVQDFEDRFRNDYITLISEVSTIFDTVIVSTPVPQLEAGGYWTDNLAVLNEVIPSIIKEVAGSFGIPYVAINELFLYKNETSGSNVVNASLYTDNVHPNDIGYTLIARAFYEDVSIILDNLTITSPPTIVPTPLPSHQPSLFSLAATESPSNSNESSKAAVDYIPTLTPSGIPTPLPTPVPTILPTTSLNESAAPSSTPLEVSTVKPSLTPTLQPSILASPTLAPTTIATLAPSPFLASGEVEAIASESSSSSGGGDSNSTILIAVVVAVVLVLLGVLWIGYRSLKRFREAGMQGRLDLDSAEEIASRSSNSNQGKAETKEDKTFSYDDEQSKTNAMSRQESDDANDVKVFAGDSNQLGYYHESGYSDDNTVINVAGAEVDVVTVTSEPVEWKSEHEAPIKEISPEGRYNDNADSHEDRISIPIPKVPEIDLVPIASGSSNEANETQCPENVHIVERNNHEESAVKEGVGVRTSGVYSFRLPSGTLEQISERETRENAFNTFHSPDSFSYMDV